MKPIVLLLGLIFAIYTPAFSQLKHDNIWPIGYGQIWPSPQGYPFGGVIMDFSAIKPNFTLLDYIFDTPKAAISDKNGNLVAYTNGCRIVNRNHVGMVNGDTLNPGEVYEGFCTDGTYSSYPLWQPCIFLPKPNSDSLYYLFHIRDDDYLWSAMNLMYSVVDATLEGGDGAVISKNNSVLSDSAFLSGYVTATRHANGRDWWVVVPRRFSNNKHVTLFTPDGVEYKGMQDFDSLNLGIDSIYWASQTAFSADGTKYFHNSNKNLLVLDFDRCTGLLSNPVRLDWDSLPFGGGGVATSPNSRFLYLTSGNTVQQYDLWAANLAASMQVVAVYDGFLAPFPTNFFQMMPGPDGKIYIVTAFDNNILHVIHNPNERGLACMVEQHALTLPARTSFFTPNFTNYNLGPIDGAACDTLGINNHPVAQFYWTIEDTLSPLQVVFTDYSYHTPNSWRWDFGDGTGSLDTSSSHVYASPGTYTVCLIACNDYSCDTVCQTVVVEAVTTLTLQDENERLMLWPNPAKDYLNIQAPAPIEMLIVQDLTGKAVFSSNNSGERATISIGQLPAGLYHISLRVAGKVWSGKFIKQ